MEIFMVKKQYNLYFILDELVPTFMISKTNILIKSLSKRLNS